MKKVVVTGGAGFIGSHLSEELSKRVNHVVILDNLFSGRMENIEPLLKKDNVEFIRGSITDLSLLQKVFRGVDYIFHQAAITSVPRSIDNPQASHEVNISGSLNVLLAARDNGVTKVICASSGSVYGDTPTLSKTENMTPNPLSPYAVTKITMEYHCQVFQKVYGLSVVCLRYFNVYGPRQDPNSQYAAVVPRFIKRISEGKSPIIFGDGEQARDFTFVKDVAEANIMAAESDAIGVFNIGRGESASVNRLAEILIRFMGRNIEPVHEAPRLGDIRDSLADISRAKTFGWEPKWSLEDGLRETVESFQHETGLG